MKFGTPVCTFCLMTGTSNEHSAPHSWQVKSSLNTESTLIEAEKVSPDSMSLLSVPFTDASSGAATHIRRSGPSLMAACGRALWSWRSEWHRAHGSIGARAVGPHDLPQSKSH